MRTAASAVPAAQAKSSRKRKDKSSADIERQKLEEMRERARAARMEADNEMAQARAMRIAAERERLAAMRLRAMSP